MHKLSCTLTAFSRKEPALMFFLTCSFLIIAVQLTSFQQEQHLSNRLKKKTHWKKSCSCEIQPGLMFFFRRRTSCGCECSPHIKPSDAKVIYKCFHNINILALLVHFTKKYQICTKYINIKYFADVSLCVR